MKKVAVVGLGQIGGSIILSLRKRNAPFELTGIDLSLKRRKLLKPFLHHTSRYWRAAERAHLTIICLHYEQTRDFLQRASPEDLLMDVCSGKSRLMRLANRKGLRFIGGHPLAGNEFAEEKGWREDLFQNAPFFLCPGTHSKKVDLRMVKHVVRFLGARPQIVNPDDHDRFVSITSHFPAILSTLFKQLAEDVSAMYQGPGFLSMTRLAATSPALLNTFLESNRANILRDAKQMWMLLDRFITETRKEHDRKHRKV